MTFFFGLVRFLRSSLGLLRRAWLTCVKKKIRGRALIKQCYMNVRERNRRKTNPMLTLSLAYSKPTSYQQFALESFKRNLSKRLISEGILLPVRACFDQTELTIPNARTCTCIAFMYFYRTRTWKGLRISLIAGRYPR